MPIYDESFMPPAPIAKIALRNIETGERIKEISVLLDTGADISLLPLPAIEKLQINSSGEKINLIGFNESQITSEIYNLQIIFLGKRISGGYCVTENETGILGRDVLNEFSIIFDGKNLEWKENK